MHGQCHAEHLMQLYFIMHALYCLGAFLDTWGLTHTVPYTPWASLMRGFTHAVSYTLWASHMWGLTHAGSYTSWASLTWGFTHVGSHTCCPLHTLGLTHARLHTCGDLTHAGLHTCWANRQHSVRAAATTFAEAEPGYLFPLFLLLQLTSHFPADKPGALHTRQANAQAPFILKRWLTSVASSFLSLLCFFMLLLFCFVLRIVYSLWQ